MKGLPNQYYRVYLYLRSYRWLGYCRPRDLLVVHGQNLFESITHSFIRNSWHLATFVDPHLSSCMVHRGCCYKGGALMTGYDVDYRSDRSRIYFSGRGRTCQRPAGTYNMISSCTHTLLVCTTVGKDCCGNRTESANDRLNTFMNLYGEPTKWVCCSIKTWQWDTITMFGIWIHNLYWFLHKKSSQSSTIISRFSCTSTFNLYERW